MRIAQQTSAARLTKPTYEKLKAQLTAVDKKLATAKTDLKAHKDVMMRSRYTEDGLKVATAKLKKLEKAVSTLQAQHTTLTKELATLRPSGGAKPSAASLNSAVERHLTAGDLKFTGKAPKKEDILTESSVHKHPFTYTAIVLKSDPKHVIIKKVLTGGFVPAQPGDGVYSQPVSIKS